MREKLKVCLIILLSLAVMVQYSFTPQILTAYGEEGEQAQASQEVDEPATSAPAPKEKASEPVSQPEPAPAAEEPAPSDSDEAESSDDSNADVDSDEAASDEAVDEEAADSEEADEEDDDVDYPAQSFSGSAGGVNVTINAPEGALPEGTKLEVSAVSAGQVQGIVEGTVDGEVSGLKAVDITFRYDGKDIEPKKSVSVRLVASGMSNASDIVHIADSGAANIVGGNVTSNGVATFSSKDFSIYIVVETDVEEDVEQNAVATYEFYVGDELVQTQYIKTGDKIADPGSALAGADEANTVFKGWFIADTDEEVTFNREMTIEKEETIRVEAKIIKTYYVTFWGEPDSEGDRGIVAVKTVQVEGDEAGEVDTTSVSVTPKADTSAFKGWALDEEGTQMAGDTEEVTGALNLYAVIVHAYWLHFYENVGDDSDSDATYTGPVFIAEDDVRSSKKPADPERKGYEFGGWYLEEDCQTAFDWSETGLEEDTDLYAKWTPGEAEFHVIVWKQKVTDDKNAADADKTYDFELSAPWEGTTGETIDLSRFSMYEELSFTGFHYGRIEASPETVKADGTTVVNVYYDRNLLTINFVDGTDLVYNETTSNNGTQYGKIGDEYIQLERHGNNAANYYWTYDVSNDYSGTTYRQVTNNQGTQYGFVGGQMVQLTYHQQFIGGYWTYGNNVRYNGTRYATPANGNSGYGIVDGAVVGISNQSGQWVYTTEERYTETRYVTATEPHVEQFTGLYGSSLSANTDEDGNPYVWPDDRAWYQNPNGGGTRLTFLDAFKFEGLSGTSQNNTVLTQYGANLTGNVEIRFYKQNVNGSYPAQPTNTVRASGGTFNITEKYEGFTAVSYRNGAAGGNTGNWTNTQAGRSVSSNNGLNIRFARNEYTLTLISEGEVVGTVSNIPYEDVMSQHEPATDPEKAHYNFEGWYEDPTGQNEFDWSSKMPAANKVLYAKWTPKQYHVSLDPNGGDFQNAQVGEFNVPLDTVLDKTSLFQNIKLEGHELVGWFDKETGEAYGFGKIEDDVNLIAKWRYPGQVKIVYDAGEHGSEPPEDNFRYATDSSVVLGPPPGDVEEGYAFVGWEVDGTRYYVNNTFDISEDIIENYDEETKTGTVTVTAIYNDLHSGSLATTSITYNANEGEGDDVVVSEGEHGDLLVNEVVTALSDSEAGFTRTGYEFTGWNTEPDGSGLDVAAGDKIAADLFDRDKNSENNILYAQWEQIKYTVVYTDDADGEAFEDRVTEDLVEGDPTPLFGDDPVRDGYKFTGWDPEVAATVSGDDADEDNVITYTAQWEEAKAAEVSVVVIGSEVKETYNGNTFTNEEYTIEWYVDGEKVDQQPEGVEFELPAPGKVEGTNADEYKLDLTQGEIVIGDDVTDYVVAEEAAVRPDLNDPCEGNIILIIEPAEITITITGTQKEYDYDGSVKIVEGYKATSSSNLFDEDKLNYDIGGEIGTQGTNAGTYTYTPSEDGFTYDDDNVTVTYEIIDGKLVIKPAEVTITTGSSEKEYDGEALTNDEATIEGLVERDEGKVTVTATGTQTEVGESDNTYDIDWGDVNQDNYTVTEKLGTLTVTDTDEPGPGPEPEPGPGPGPTPNGGGDRTPVVPATVTPVPAPAAIADAPTPTTINDEPAPMANNAVWALLNLLAMLATALLSLIMLARYFGKRQEEDEDTGEVTEYKRKGAARLASLVPAIGSIIAFILTEDMSSNMVMVDKWTLMMVVILAIQAGVGILAKVKKDGEEQDYDEA